jgi:RimJ/RimL family protein N-acetyltransferase
VCCPGFPVKVDDLSIKLQTNRLILRRLEEHDAKAMYRYRSDPRVTKFQTWEPKDVEEVETFISEQQSLEMDKPGTWFQLAITLKESNLFVGDCGLHFLDTHKGQVELGITIAPEHQGLGYASEAVSAVLTYLFNRLSKHRVLASTDPSNQEAIALLERVGMRREAHFHQSLWWKRKWVDEFVYAILAETWGGKN